MIQFSRSAEFLLQKYYSVFVKKKFEVDETKKNDKKQLKKEVCDDLEEESKRSLSYILKPSSSVTQNLFVVISIISACG